MEKDLFEEVARAAGCEYISDMKLKAYNNRAKKNSRRVDCLQGLFAQGSERDL